MPVKIKLIDAEELTVDVDVDAFAKAFQQALSSGRVLEVEDVGRRRILTINPQSVSYYYLEEAADREQQAAEPETPEPEPAAR